MSVLVFIEADSESIKKGSQEAIAYGAYIAQQLNTSVTGLAIGNFSHHILSSAGNYGANAVLYVQDARIESTNPMVYAAILEQAIIQTQATIIVATKTGLADAVLARVAAKLKAGLASGVIEKPQINGDSFIVKQSIYTGKAFAQVRLNSTTKFLLLRKNAIDIRTSDSTATVTSLIPTLSDNLLNAKVVSTEKVSGKLSITDADIIVSGGRGMKGPENWQPLLDLADALGAATGCSKPVSDLDWRPHHEHIGQTGIKVAPNLYIACGISGAIQHLAGVNGSKCIVAINKDPEAPFFKVANYGIVGDVMEVLPKLTAAVNKVK